MLERQEQIEALLNNANTILNKYDNDYIQPQETFIHMFDKYILHAIEEVYEARQASDEEFYEEVADIVNYTATMVEILRANLKTDKYPKVLKIPHNKDLSIERSKELLAYIYDDLISMRRLFPQRKWHKNEQMDNFEDILNSCVKCCLGVMSALLDMVGFEKLLKISIEKQLKIIDLEPVNK